ncbi:hypothetical protein [Pseudomonas pseudonitroreducens]|uniref:hypothetical protein n=1 Tax=Pseudomonas pseudonitroreducens TaxID=2892326 RepID=UPI001F345A6D|nr:hypothetical protein [Pseudomonas pseudonitroreducens]
MGIYNFYQVPKVSRLPHLISYSRAVYLGLVLGFFSVAFLRTAWVTEDAYITFRVIDNLNAGYGLVWNLGERVQVFTHPLWLFLLSPVVAVLHDPFWASLLVSYALLVCVLCLLFFLGRERPLHTMAVLLALLASRSFIDYSSSGLENPLVHLLLISFLWVYLRCKTASWRLEFLGSLFSALYLTRPDSVVVIVPAMLGEFIGFFWRERRVPWKLLVGTIPIISWTAFSLFYFGSAFPNTALAKLGTGLSVIQSFEQALAGIRWVASMDFVTLALIAGGTGVALLHKNLPFRLVGTGIALWFLYYMKAGGDYMGGRFFSPITVIAVWLLIERIRVSALSTRFAWALSVGLVLLVSLRPHHMLIPALAQEDRFFDRPAGGLFLTLLSPQRFNNMTIDNDGMADERGFYYLTQGMLPNMYDAGAREGALWAALGSAASQKPGVYLACNIGAFGYFAGREVEIIDPYALSDPFLARLPVRDGARIGHYERALPGGYLETVLTGSSRLHDPALERLWHLISEVSRGDLFSLARLAAIYELNVRASELVRASTYERNDVILPGYVIQSTSKRSCLGQTQAPFIWSVKLREGGAVVAHFSAQ